MKSNSKSKDKYGYKRNNIIYNSNININIHIENHKNVVNNITNNNYTFQYETTKTQDMNIKTHDKDKIISENDTQSNGDDMKFEMEYKTTENIPKNIKPKLRSKLKEYRKNARKELNKVLFRSQKNMKHLKKNCKDFGYDIQSLKIHLNKHQNRMDNIMEYIQSQRIFVRKQLDRNTELECIKRYSIVKTMKKRYEKEIQRYVKKTNKKPWHFLRYICTYICTFIYIFLLLNCYIYIFFVYIYRLFREQRHHTNETNLVKLWGYDDEIKEQIREQQDKHINDMYKQYDKVIKSQTKNSNSNDNITMDCIFDSPTKKANIATNISDNNDKISVFGLGNISQLKLNDFNGNTNTNTTPIFRYMEPGLTSQSSFNRNMLNNMNNMRLNNVFYDDN